MYANTTDLILAFGDRKLAELTTDDPNIDCPDIAKLTYALERATAEIDSYLGDCYDVPLTDVPAIIKFKTIDLARYHLESGCECSEKVKENYEKTVEWFKELCCGECPPDIPGLKKKSGTSKVGYYSKTRIFTRENLKRYVCPRASISSQKLIYNDL